MGLAFGLKAEALGLDKHFVDPISLLKTVKEISL
jgi:heterodisulfide reductase subunit B